ncbi:MAG: hypothetical protein ABEI86_02625 [Halobacteriaceae archaeon]
MLQPLGHLTPLEIHIIELALTTGIIAALLWNQQHDISITILTIGVLLTLGEYFAEFFWYINNGMYRMGTNPIYFIVPMFASFTVLVILEEKIRTIIENRSDRVRTILSKMDSNE